MQDCQTAVYWTVQVWDKKKTLQEQDFPSNATATFTSWSVYWSRGKTKLKIWLVEVPFNIEHTLS